MNHVPAPSGSPCFPQNSTLNCIHTIFSATQKSVFYFPLSPAERPETQMFDIIFIFFNLLFIYLSGLLNVWVAHFCKSTCNILSFSISRGIMPVVWFYYRAQGRKLRKKTLLLGMFVKILRYFLPDSYKNHSNYQDFCSTCSIIRFKCMITVKVHGIFMHHLWVFLPRMREEIIYIHF